MKHLTINQKKILNQLLSKVGDMFFKRRILTMLEYLNIQENDKILDAGCGEGFYELIISSLYDCHITAFDNDPEILNSAKRRIGKSENIKLEQQNIMDLPYKDNSFDKILCTEVLEHLDRDEKAAEELYRVLKPGGILAVTVPNKNFPLLWDPFNKIRSAIGLGHFNPKGRLLGGVWSYDHKRLYSPLELRLKLEGVGFKNGKINVISRYGLPFYLLVLNLGKLFYTKLPVGDSITNEMEKFNWDRKAKKKSFAARIIKTGFCIIKFLDVYNDKNFSIETPTMGICMLCIKK